MTIFLALTITAALVVLRTWAGASYLRFAEEHPELRPHLEQRASTCGY